MHTTSLLAAPSPSICPAQRYSAEKRAVARFTNYLFIVKDQYAFLIAYHTQFLANLQGNSARHSLSYQVWQQRLLFLKVPKLLSISRQAFYQFCFPTPACSRKNGLNPAPLLSLPLQPIKPSPKRTNRLAHLQQLSLEVYRPCLPRLIQDALKHASALLQEDQGLQALAVVETGLKTCQAYPLHTESTDGWRDHFPHWQQTLKGYQSALQAWQSAPPMGNVPGSLKSYLQGLDKAIQKSIKSLGMQGADDQDYAHMRQQFLKDPQAFAKYAQTAKELLGQAERLDKLIPLLASPTFPKALKALRQFYTAAAEGLNLYTVYADPKICAEQSNASEQRLNEMADNLIGYAQAEFESALKEFAFCIEIWKLFVVGLAKPAKKQHLEVISTLQQGKLAEFLQCGQQWWPNLSLATNPRLPLPF